MCKLKCGMDWEGLEESNGGIKSRVRFRNGRNRSKEDSPATASFFANFRPNHCVVDRIDWINRFLVAWRADLHFLSTNGSLEPVFRRSTAVQGRRL